MGSFLTSGLLENLSGRSVVAVITFFLYHRSRVSSHCYGSVRGRNDDHGWGTTHGPWVHGRWGLVEISWWSMVSSVGVDHRSCREMVYARGYTIHLIVRVDFVVVVNIAMVFSVFLLWGSSVGDIFWLLVTFLVLLVAESPFPETVPQNLALKRSRTILVFSQQTYN